MRRDDGWQIASSELTRLREDSGTGLFSIRISDGLRRPLGALADRWDA